MRGDGGCSLGVLVWLLPVLCFCLLIRTSLVLAHSYSIRRCVLVKGIDHMWLTIAQLMGLMYVALFSSPTMTHPVCCSKCLLRYEKTIYINFDYVYLHCSINHRQLALDSLRYAYIEIKLPPVGQALTLHRVFETTTVKSLVKTSILEITLITAYKHKIE